MINIETENPADTVADAVALCLSGSLADDRCASVTATHAASRSADSPSPPARSEDCYEYVMMSRSLCRR